jgi:hypothetical protein
MAERKFRARYVSGEEKQPPYFSYVCSHLTPTAEESVEVDMVETLANDPGAYGNNFQVRICEACDAALTAERRRLGDLPPEKLKPLSVKTKRGDFVKCDCGQVVAASSIRHHLMTGFVHTAGRFAGPNLSDKSVTGTMTQEQIDEWAVRLLKTKLIPDDQLRIDWSAFEEVKK